MHCNSILTCMMRTGQFTSGILSIFCKKEKNKEQTHYVIEIIKSPLQ